MLCALVEPRFQRTTMLCAAKSLAFSGPECTAHYLNSSRNNSQGIVVPFYHALHTARLIQMPAKKKEEVVFIFICNGKTEEAERLI